MAQGHVRGLSQVYADGLERMEIWVTKNKARSLPYQDNIRIPIRLNIASHIYNAGLRSTPDNEYVWICPDLRDSDNKKISLSRVLFENGFKKNDRVFLSVDGDVIHVNRAWATGDEIPITYEKEQRELYVRKDPKCKYEQFERQVGINKGNFVEMVAKKYFEDQGYCVESFYYIVRNRKKREGMPGFKRIIKIFGEEKVRQLIAEADSAFLSDGKSKASGDPDLFVYYESTEEYFFVEVKEPDPITNNQRTLFPLIERHLCPVFIARVVAKSMHEDDNNV